MSNRGPVIILDDDIDDHAITLEALKEIGIKNEILTFTRCEDLYDFLLSHLQTQPFIIISDINLPKLNGIELKKMIDDNPVLRKKSIPFVYYSTSGNKSLVEKAFANQIQGFFVKKNKVEDIENCFRKIFQYWEQSLHPEDQ